MWGGVQGEDLMSIVGEPLLAAEELSKGLGSIRMHLSARVYYGKGFV